MKIKKSIHKFGKKKIKNLNVKIISINDLEKKKLLKIC